MPAPSLSRRLALLLAALLASGVSASDQVYQQARELFEEGKIEDTAALAEEGLRRQPDDPPLLRLLGEARSRLGQYRASFQAYRGALALRPGDPRVLGNLRGLRKPLVGELRAVLRESAGDVEARHALAFLLMLEGKRQKARAQLERITRLAPGFAAGWNDLAWLEWTGGRRREAFVAVSKAFELDPGNPGVRRHFELIRKGKALGGSPKADRIFGIWNPRSDAPVAPPPTAKATTTPDPTTPARIDFGKVNLEDDQLVASLLTRIEEETLGPQGATDPTTEAATVEPDGGDEPDQGLLPTPLEVLKRIQDSYDRARDLLEKHRYEDAVKSLRLVVSLKRDYRDARALLQKSERTLMDLDRLDQGKLLVDAGDGRRALGELTRVPRKLVEQARPQLDMDALLGTAYSQTGDHSTAEKYLRAAAGRAPREAELQYRLFMALVEQGKAGEALEQLAILEQASPGYARKKEGHRKVVMRLYIRKYFLVVAGLAGIWVVALLAYLVFFGRRKVRTDSFATWMDAAQDALRHQDWKGLLEQVVRLDGLGLEGDRKLRVGVLRVTGQVGVGQLEEAAAGLEVLEGEFGETSSTRVLRGRIHLARGEAHDEARPFLDELLQAEPGNRELLELLHETAWAGGDLSDPAYEVLGRLLDLDPDNPSYIVRMTAYLGERGDTSEKAVRLYGRTLQIDEEHLEARRMLARALMGAGKALEALREVKLALRKASKDEELLGLAGDAYRQLELYEEGRAFFEKLVESGAGSVARARLEELGRLGEQVKAEESRSREEEKTLGSAYDQGVQLFGQGRFGEAIPHLTQALEAASYRKHAGALLVKANLELGEVETAWQAFESLDVPEVPSDEFMIGLCYDMASALQKRSDYSRARDLYRMVCKADVDFKDAFERFEELEEQLQLSSD